MARHTERDTTKIYQSAELFRADCLLRDGSLLFLESSVWTLDALEILRKVFVATPDESDRNFMTKFEEQVRPAGQAVLRLAAEVLCVYFLFPSNVGGPRKREVVNTILGWGGDSLDESGLISNAFAHGIGSGGYGYNTRRPFEIAFLIEFAIAWKKLPETEQAVAAKDPILFQAIVDQIEEGGTKQLRHMLLYLMFPDYFERIASGGHKRRVVEAFSGLIKDLEPENEDAAIYAIRQALEKLLPGKKLDFYWSPLSETWYDSSDDIVENAPLELIQYKKQIVLYGPPGTGKTYTAKKLAAHVIHAAALRDMGPATYFQSQVEIEKAISSNVHRLQLHPAYSYEDFVRALHIAPNGATEYRAGFLPKLVAEIASVPRAKRLPHVLILDEMNRTDLSRMLGECFSLLEDRGETVELPGRDQNDNAMTLSLPDDLFVIGTMNLIDQSIEQIDFALRRRFLWLACPFSKEALLGASEAKWTTLHAKQKWERIEPDFRKLAANVEALNDGIHKSKWLGAQYEIGHTYFIDVAVFLHSFLGPAGGRKQTFLWNKKGDAMEPVQRVWSLSIQPLLEQYLSGLNADDRNAELARLSKVFLKATATE